jgi:hypothetical protein
VLPRAEHVFLSASDFTDQSLSLLSSVIFQCVSVLIAPDCTRQNRPRPDGAVPCVDGAMKSTSTIAVFVIMMTVAHAEPRPVPKPQGPGGSRPHGYISSGSFCAPS